MAFLEVTLPDFGMPVLYEDALNLGLRQKYNYPSYLVEGYQTFAENINRHAVDQPDGRKLSCLASTSTKNNKLSEEATYDALYKRVKLHNVQISSGTEAYEAE